MQRAARTISELDVRRRIFIIAHDSMGGRDTPSPGLRKTADYIAGEFRRLGLRPGGDSGTFLLQYPIEQRKVLAQKSTVRVSRGDGTAVTLSFAHDAALVFTQPARTPIKGNLVLLSGPLNPDSVKPDAIKDRIALIVPPPQSAGISGPLYLGLQRAGVAAILVLVSDTTVFQRFLAAQAQGYQAVGADAEDPGRNPMLIFALEQSITAQVPEAAQQFEHLRAQTTPGMQPMPDWMVEVSVSDTAVVRARAPNVVGIVEGSDSTLKHEYLVFSAHMDHVGTAGQPGSQCSPAANDRICNGADDDGSGTVGVVELAEAFSSLEHRPKRSLIFLTVSGEEHGLWGSDWFAQHPPVPLAQIVADFNIDMIGRNWKDTIVAIGKEHSDLGATLNRVNAAHPELHMTAIDDRWPEESFYTRSDHYNFARRGVPILFFFNGVHADYHQPSDSPDKIDAEKESRILQLLFYLGLDVANASERPKWVPESYHQIVKP